MGTCPIDQPELTGHNYVREVVPTQGRSADSIINEAIEEEEAKGASLEDVIFQPETEGYDVSYLLLFFKPNETPPPEGPSMKEIVEDAARKVLFELLDSSDYYNLNQLEQMRRINKISDAIASATPKIAEAIAAFTGKDQPMISLEGADYVVKDHGILHPKESVDWKWEFDLTITDESGKENLNDMPLWVTEGLRDRMPTYCLITEMNPRRIKEEEE